MELFIKTVFWIATLNVCLQASPLTTLPPSCMLKLEDSRIKQMRTDVNCPFNSTFYAPQDVKKECITAALDCAMREFNGTVREECEDENEYIDQEVQLLERKIKDCGKEYTLDSTECPCEKWPTHNFTDFMDKVKALYGFINSVVAQ